MVVEAQRDDAWPPLPWEAWKDTCDTFHIWLQVVGKIKLKLSPFLNEWWHVALELTARGMTTGLIPYQRGAFQIDFDFIDHTATIRVDAGDARSIPLRPQSVADFYKTFFCTLSSMGLQVSIHTLPVEVPNPIPFEEDTEHASYDPSSVTRWWRIQLQTALALQRFRSGFVGKSSPINFFWGSFDLSHTRFSGRPADPPAGMPRFFQLSEDQENAAFGFWPGNANMAGFTLSQPAFYAYVYPAPDGCATAPVRPDSAHFHEALGEFILPYDAIRNTA